MPKLKFSQYKVRGKHRNYYVVAFPNHPHIWPNYENFDEEYIIDASADGWRILRYAIAVLLEAEDRIVYLPTRNNNRTTPIRSFYENYDAVLTIHGLHLRRSEWIKLRRQLNPANRVQNFALRYRPEKIVSQAEAESEQYMRWHYNKLESQTQKNLLGNTIFFSLPREWYASAFASSLEVELDIQDNEWGQIVDIFFGWMLPNKTITYCCESWKEYNKEFL